MIHTVSVEVSFRADIERVYNELTDLSRYPLWNSGMVSIEPKRPMREGMTFRTITTVLGRENVSNIQVLKLKPNRCIELRSDTGIITFDADYELAETGDGETILRCGLRFDLVGIALNFAHPVIEAMAEHRLKSDFEMLKTTIEAGI